MMDTVRPCEGMEFFAVLYYIGAAIVSIIAAIWYAQQ